MLKYNVKLMYRDYTVVERIFIGKDAENIIRKMKEEFKNEDIISIVAYYKGKYVLSYGRN